MKIKDILGEDGVEIKQGAAAITTNGGKDTLGMAADPATATAVKAMVDSGKLNFGDQNAQQRSMGEETPADPIAQQYVQQINQFMQQATEPWEKAQLQARLQAVQDGQVPHAANGGPIKQLPPREWEANLAKTSPSTLTRMLGVFGTSAYSPEYLKQHNMLSRGLDYVGLEEADLTEKKHKDTMAQGGGDIGGKSGGDMTDDFIDDVKDKGYERKNRNPGSGNRGPISGDKLKETDELYKWLTIAGIK